MSQRDIAEQIKNLYDVEISPELVSKISGKIMPEVNAWQTRPLEKINLDKEKINVKPTSNNVKIGSILQRQTWRGVS